MSSDACVLGIGCFLGAAGLTLLWYSERAKKEAQYLTSATRLSLKELGKLFEDGNQDAEQLDIVAVCGKVGSSTPMACKISGLKGVLVEEKAEVQFERKHYGSWIPDSTLTQLKTQEVPWYLDDGSGELVYVRGARDAHRFNFPVKREALDDYPKTDPHHKFVKMFGVKRTESLIPTGTSLSVVGQAVKDEEGRVWIQSPPELKGRFYVVRMSIDELVAYLQQNGRLFKEFSKFLLVSVGVVYVFGWMSGGGRRQSRFAPTRHR